VRIPEQIVPQAILLRKPAEEKFLAAAGLEKKGQSGNGFSVYRWQFLIDQRLDQHPETGFEAALLDESAGILYAPLSNEERSRLIEVGTRVVFLCVACRLRQFRV